jgi:hypothetical protein
MLLVHLHMKAVYRSIDFTQQSVPPPKSPKRRDRLCAPNCVSLFLRDQSDRGVYPTAHLRQVPMLRISGAEPPLPYAVIASTGNLPAMIPVMCHGIANCRRM